MSKGSNAVDDALALLETHGRFLRHTGSNELWSVAKSTVVIPHDRKQEGAWLTARRDIRRALRAAGVALAEEKTMAASPALPVAAPRPLPAAEEARSLADAGVALGERAEALALEVDKLVADLAAETRRRERAEDELHIAQKKVETSAANLARFNGRDWPRELEETVAQRKRAEADAIELKARVAHLEQAIRSMSAAGFSGK